MYATALIFILNIGQSYATDWSTQAKLPGTQICENLCGHHVCFSDGNRKNILEIEDATEWQKMIKAGARHTLSYPVDVTRIRIPKETLEKYFALDDSNPLRRLFFKIAQSLSNIRSFDDIFKFVGLVNYPESIQSESPNYIPKMANSNQYPMGTTIFDVNGHQSISFSCAACHASDLFGVKILGLPNRFPRANHAFVVGKKAISKVPTSLYSLILNPSAEDLKDFETAKHAMSFVMTKEPKAIGLDTSLAQVGLSLALRQDNAYAELKPNDRRRRREYKKHPLHKIPADSKPATWWNLKYKTRFLSDGSLVSGNPIHTNFLWNEIGRGADLHKLETWLINNKRKIDELTAYVFNTEAPRFNDFFPNHIDISSAKRGEILFNNSCKGCHGIYEKNWSRADAHLLSYAELLENKKVWYPTQSRAIDVKTDEHRFKGMQYFYRDLNKLKISKTINTVVEPQQGYIPPPLIGIWARWPYFHNNSVPSLYEVLTPDFKRAKSYISVAAIDKKIDFDLERNGYPKPDLVRQEFRDNKLYFYNTAVPGMSNKGHTKMLLDANGHEKFDHQDRLDLIAYLKTL